MSKPCNTYAYNGKYLFFYQKTGREYRNTRMFTAYQTGDESQP